VRYQEPGQAGIQDEFRSSMTIPKISVADIYNAFVLRQPNLVKQFCEE